MSRNRTRELFELALPLTPAEREALLERECANDLWLRREVESLLSCNGSAEAFLEVPIASLPSPTEWEAELGLPVLREFAPGDALGEYVVQEKLGEGGMGVVYLAEQRAPVRRRVALKVLKAGADDRDSAARFALESQALALMEHPNVARVFEAGTTAGGRPFFAMEFVAGIPLHRYCDARRLSIEERLELFLDVCEGVQHAHQKGILHRDLKPSNLLVRDDGNGPTPKIIDFGVAKATTHGLTDASLRTLPGVFLGTPDYMSPEQARSEGRDVDSRTDVYSLGVVLYELLAGRLPHEFRHRRDTTYLSIQRALAEEDPPLPSRALLELGPAATEVAALRSTSLVALRRKLAGDLDWIVGKAIEKDRARRFPTVSELAADVRRYLRHEPVLATPPGRVYRLRKFALRNRLWVAVFATLVLGLASTTYMAVEAASARRSADRSLRYSLPLADMALLTGLREEAERLWPPEPAKIPAMDAWIVRVTVLLSRRSQHARMDERIVPGSALSQIRGDAPAGIDIEAFAQRAYGDIVSELLRGLQELSDPSAPIGSLAEMRQRREFAARVEHDTIVAPATLWEEAIASISDLAVCPSYDGLRIRPQLGLVPIGRDPDSGLWEFAHLQTGNLPTRDASGRIAVSADTALVLVLIPGGAFDMGAIRDDERLDLPNHDRAARGEEGPIHPIALDPYFLSKYEMSQSQWLRLAGEMSPRYANGERVGDHVHDLRHPIDQISWHGAVRVLARARLILPTEAQWEFAARAGTTTPWWTGSDKKVLGNAANVCDSAAKRFFTATWYYELRVDDGYAASAPIGSFRANPFGLHDVSGNVWEWVHDRFAPYTDPVRAGDGERILGAETLQLPEDRVTRGGAWDGSSDQARMARRCYHPPFFIGAGGVRPARSLDR